MQSNTVHACHVSTKYLDCSRVASGKLFNGFISSRYCNVVVFRSSRNRRRAHYAKRMKVNSSILLPLKNKLISMKGLPGLNMAATIATKKQGTNVCGEEGTANCAKQKADPIVAFSKPPPMAPLLGPLIALSLLDTRDAKDE